MKKDSKIYVAGHRGMVGSAIVRYLTSLGYNNIITRTKDELDLTNQISVRNFFELEKPEYVFVAAAKVGGILANNTYRAEFLYDNLSIQNNLIHNAYVYGVKKLLFLGSSCIYPKMAPQPLKEEFLLSGYLEPTNEPYAIAKITGIKMCEILCGEFLFISKIGWRNTLGLLQQQYAFIFSAQPECVFVSTWCNGPNGVLMGGRIVVNIGLMYMQITIFKIIGIGYGAIHYAIVYPEIPKCPCFVVFWGEVIPFKMIGTIHHRIVIFTP